MSPANEPRQSKAERTAAAREKAREIREAQLKKDKRNKLLIGWGIVAAVVAIIVIVALVVTSNIQNNAPVADEGPTPANGNIHGGVTLLANTEVAKTDPATVKLSDTPVRAGHAAGCRSRRPAPKLRPASRSRWSSTSTSSAPCARTSRPSTTRPSPTCATKARSPWSTARWASWTRRSTTNYSSRAANAAACVVNESPEKYADFVNVLFAKQPAEGGAGISDDGSEEDGHRHRGQEHRHVRG